MSTIKKLKNKKKPQKTERIGEDMEKLKTLCAVSGM